MTSHRQGRIAGQIAVITGGASGLGRACAARLMGEGATVVIADIDSGAAARAAAELGAAAESFGVDICDEAAVAALMSYVVGRHRRLDILVTSAALTEPAHQSRDLAVGDLDADIWERTLAVDLRGTMLCCKYAVRIMARQQGGSVVTISSNSALAGDLSLTAYSAAKAGVNALTRSVATAYGKHGVRVNAVSPGSISSPSLALNVPPEVVDMLQRNCLLPRMGRPEDVADAVLFLASPEAAFITGQVLRVDGGTLSQLPHVPAMRGSGATTITTTSSFEPDGVPR